MAIILSETQNQQASLAPVGFSPTRGIPTGAGEPSRNDETTAYSLVPTPGTANETVPPIANREVEIPIPSENRSLLDWVSFTFKLDDPHEVAGIIGIDTDLFTPFPFGFSGYRKSLRFGNISIYFDGRDDMGCHVEMSGQGCRQFEVHFSENPWQKLFQTVLSENGKFTRLDLAIDNVDGALSLEKVSDALQTHDNHVRTQFGEWRRIQKGSFRKGEKITGDTIYLGSSKSHVMCRCYDKALLTKTEGHWIRFEIQLRDNRAHEAARLFTSGVPVGELATGIINNYFSIINDDDSNISRCSLQTWWADWLQSTEKIRLTTEQAIKLVSDSMDFIKRQYAPSLAMIKKHLGVAPFKGFMQDVLEDGNERMGPKHEKILAASEAARGDK
jgi:phage replication initiation protein